MVFPFIYHNGYIVASLDQKIVPYQIWLFFLHILFFAKN